MVDYFCTLSIDRNSVDVDEVIESPTDEFFREPYDLDRGNEPSCIALVGAYRAS